jgi:hypothetical protein
MEPIFKTQLVRLRGPIKQAHIEYFRKVLKPEAVAKPPEFCNDLTF